MDSDKLNQINKTYKPVVFSIRADNESIRNLILEFARVPPPATPRRRERK